MNTVCAWLRMGPHGGRHCQRAPFWPACVALVALTGCHIHLHVAEKHTHYAIRNMADAKRVVADVKAAIANELPGPPAGPMITIEE